MPRYAGRHPDVFWDLLTADMQFATTDYWDGLGRYANTTTVRHERNLTSGPFVILVNRGQYCLFLFDTAAQERRAVRRENGQYCPAFP